MTDLDFYVYLILGIAIPGLLVFSIALRDSIKRWNEYRKHHRPRRPHHRPHHPHYGHHPA